jgi:hypothetical protein
MGYGAAIATNGVKTGGKLFVVSYSFADLAEESNTLRHFITDNSVRKQGASELIFTTACGDITVAVYQYAKAGQAMFIAADNFKRVGSTDITMRPIGGGAQGFFTHSTTTAGAQIKCFSNQAPVFEMPFRNFLITGIVNSNSSGVVAAT